jgi:hypothetical protein
MFGFSAADWFFCVFILFVIAICVAISALVQSQKSSNNQ